MNTLREVTRSLAIGGALMAASLAPASAADDRSYGFIDGFVVHDQERIPENAIGGGGRIGWGLPFANEGRTAVEASLFGNPINRKAGDNGKQYGLMLDLVQGFAATEKTEPFIFAGVGAVKDDIGPVSSVFLGVEAGLGLKIAVTDNLSVRSSFSAQDVRDDKFAGRSSFVDYRLSLGLAMPFGAKAAAAPPRIADSDGDGLPDSQDKCPTVAAATSDGCPPPAPVAPPMDSDNDGVDDSQDACAGTLQGMQVDARGCAVDTGTQSIVLKGVTFLTGSAELTPAAKAELDKAYDALAGQTAMKVEIGGHTDSMGDAKKNMALSQARADSVRKYLVGKGIDAGRLTAKGYGSTQPIADNKTKAGRAENRRVEFKIVR